MPYSPTLMFFTGMCIGCCIPSLIRSRACDPALHQEYRGFSRAAYWINCIEQSNVSSPVSTPSNSVSRSNSHSNHSSYASSSIHPTDIHTELPVANAIVNPIERICTVENIEY